MTRPRLRLISCLLSLVLVLSLAAPALAADAPGEVPITIELNGQLLAQAQEPQLTDDRTFVPARAVLEAMGVKVDWDGATETVTAVRGDRTLTMVIGQKTARLVRAGVEELIEMDAAPYISGDFTFIPIRFAAQSFGCTVGWDADKRTAIIADTETLAKKAMEGHTFTMLQKFADYHPAALTKASAHDLEGLIHFALGGLTMASATLSAKGTVLDQSADLTSSADIDLTPIMAMSGVSGEDLAQAKQHTDATVRGDLSTGKFYLTSAQLNDLLALPQGTWFSLDLARLAEEYDTQLFDMEPAFSVDGLFLTAAAQYPLSVRGESFQAFTAYLDQLADLYDDAAFTENPDGFEGMREFYAVVSPPAEDQSSSPLTSALHLFTDQEGTTTGTAQSLQLALDLSPLLEEAPPELLQNLSSMSIDPSSFAAAAQVITMNEKSYMTVILSAGAGLSFSIQFEDHYTPTDAQPKTAPDAAEVIDLFTLLTSLEAPDTAKAVTVKVVGKDGPTVLFLCRTDADTLGKLLLEYGIAQGDQGQYGLFITAVNGYTANMDAQEWWCITKNGQSVNTGADTTPIADGDQFELTLKTGW